MESTLMTCITSMFLRQRRKLKQEAKIHFQRQTSLIFLEKKIWLMESLFQLKKTRSQSTKHSSKDIFHAKEKWKSSFKSFNHHTQKKTYWTFYLTFTEDLVKNNSIAITYLYQKLLKLVFQKVKMRNKFNSSKNFFTNQNNCCQLFQKRATLWPHLLFIFQKMNTLTSWKL